MTMNSMNEDKDKEYYYDNNDKSLNDEKSLNAAIIGSTIIKDDDNNDNNVNVNVNRLLKQTIQYYGERLSAADAHAHADHDGSGSDVVVFCELLIYNESESDDDDGNKVKKDKNKKKKKILVRPDDAYWRKIPPMVNNNNDKSVDDKSVDENDNGTDNLLLLREKLLADVFLYNDDNDDDDCNDNDNKNKNKTNEQQQQQQQQSCCRIRRHQVCDIIKNDKRLLSSTSSSSSSSSSSTTLLQSIDEIVTVRFDDVSPSPNSSSISSFTGMMCWYIMILHDDNKKKMKMKKKNKNQSVVVVVDVDNDNLEIINDDNIIHQQDEKEFLLITATDHIATTYAFLVLQQQQSTRIMISSSLTNTDVELSRSNNRNSNNNNNNNSDIEEGATTITTTMVIDSSTLHQQPLEITQNEHEHEHEREHGRQSHGVDVEGAKTCLCCITNEIKRDFIAYITKFKGKGGGNLCPKQLDWKQTIFTFIGSFITIYIINLFNIYLNNLNEKGYNNIIPIPVLNTNTTATTTGNDIAAEFSDNKNDKTAKTALIMGPFGATVVLIFAMTSMSPSQPRNTIGGALCGMIIGKVISYSSSLGVSLGIRMSLATALSAAVMSKMCILYPPGGALALLFSSQLLGWDKVILQLFGTILVLLLGVIINNLHPLRTYPSYWFGIDTNKLFCHSSTTTAAAATTTVLREDHNDKNNDNSNGISDSGLLSNNMDSYDSNNFHDDGTRRIHDEC